MPRYRRLSSQHTNSFLDTGSVPTRVGEHTRDFASTETAATESSGRNCSKLARSPQDSGSQPGGQRVVSQNPVLRELLSGPSRDYCREADISVLGGFSMS